MEVHICFRKKLVFSLENRGGEKQSNSSNKKGGRKGKMENKVYNHHFRLISII